MTRKPIPDPDWVETCLAARLAALLHESAVSATPDIDERLRVAREQAVLRARAARTAGSAATPVTVGGGLAALGRRSGWWSRLTVLLPLAVAIAGTVWFAESRQRERAAVAAEIDAVLLADDLPPAAYADPGFAAFLKLQQP